jgi:hypothetical protein
LANELESIFAISDEPRTAIGRRALAVVAYVLATFLTQAVSHFVVNRGHYAAVTYLRPEPIFSLGIASMLIQGAVLGFLYSRTRTAGRSIGDALRFAWLAGSILVSYIALAEAAKYRVPAIGSWLAVEIVAGFAQFTFYGVLLGLIYARQCATSAGPGEWRERDLPA